VLVDDDLAHHVVWHWRDWDPAGAQPPSVGAPKVRCRHVLGLVQKACFPLMEVLAAKAVRLMARLHLGSVGELRHGGEEGDEGDEGSLQRECPAMASGQDFIGAASGGRARVARIYACLCSNVMARCAAVQSCRQCSYSTQVIHLKRIY
jgi:hypothetical protein